mmetsp:Transcript_11351/g.19232  ORF Transcript_11351/g.19232 Transcript_11351/m.19232 type:complete len:104 (-) Transcript_11351:1449-1760(-)
MADYQTVDTVVRTTSLNLKWENAGAKIVGRPAAIERYTVELQKKSRGRWAQCGRRLADRAFLVVLCEDMKGPAAERQGLSRWFAGLEEKQKGSVRRIWCFFLG